MQWNQSRNSSTVVGSAEFHLPRPHLRSIDEKHLRENLTACSVGLCPVAAFRMIDDRATEHKQWSPQRFDVMWLTQIWPLLLGLQ